MYRFIKLFKLSYFIAQNNEIYTILLRVIILYILYNICNYIKLEDIKIKYVNK